MSKICSKYTKVENLVFKGLRKKKIYFQTHYDKVAGNPDIALPRKKKAVFVDGDFWHGYQLQKLRKRLPKRYWIGKIEGNVLRDKRNRRLLRKQGWTVLKIWEHDIINDFNRGINKIADFLK